MNHSFLSVFIFIIISVNSNTTSQIGGRIVGGDPASPQQFPYQAALFIDIIDSEDLGFCGGSLISPDYVLTAAHCVVIAEEITVVLGVVDIDTEDPDQVRLSSREFIPHENYQDYRNWDIALIKLPQSVEFSSYIQPIKLAKGNNTFADEVAIVTGWGATTPDDPTSESHLRYAENVILTNQQCQEQISQQYVFTVKSSHLCLSMANQRGSCHGDSGGPLVVSNVQVGIASFGDSDCSNEEVPGVYTRVTSYRGWIRKHSGV